MNEFNKVTLKLSLGHKLYNEMALFQAIVSTIYILESCFNIVNNLLVIVLTCSALCGYVIWRAKVYEKYIEKILNILEE